MAEEKTQIEEIEEEQKKKEKEESKEEVKEESKEEVKKESKEEVKKEKKSKKERTGILYINTTDNNTILTVTDMAGNTVSRSSGGQSTKQSRLKASPTVAMFAAKKVSEESRDAGITNLYVKIKAKTGSSKPGSASHAVVKSLGREGFKILSIMEITKNPRGGPKTKGGRRGRRV